MAEAETRIIRGNKRLFLVTLTGSISELIVSHAFAGLEIISFTNKGKNLLAIKIKFKRTAKLNKFMVYCFMNRND
jgi:hypothetical protein